MARIAEIRDAVIAQDPVIATIARYIEQADSTSLACLMMVIKERIDHLNTATTKSQNEKPTND